MKDKQVSILKCMYYVNPKYGIYMTSIIGGDVLLFFDDIDDTDYTHECNEDNDNQEIGTGDKRGFCGDI